MKIKEIMTSPVTTVTPETKVGAIARLMVDNNISGVPVVNLQNRVVGIVTEGDLIVRNANLHLPRFIQILDARIYVENPREFEEELRKLMGGIASDIMSSPVMVVHPDEDVDRAATIMMEKRVTSLPVMDGEKLVGIISRSDIVRLVADQESQQEEE